MSRILIIATLISTVIGFFFLAFGLTVIPLMIASCLWWITCAWLELRDDYNWKCYLSLIIDAAYPIITATILRYSNPEITQGLTQKSAFIFSTALIISYFSINMFMGQLLYLLKLAIINITTWIKNEWEYHSNIARINQMSKGDSR